MDNIREAIDNLPQKNVTIYVLEALDSIVPGAWTNITDFGEMVQHVTGETNPARSRQISARAIELYHDPANSGYQRALWIYQTVDRVDTALGAAAMANKVGQKIDLLSFLNRITLKADLTQAIDFGLKVAAELVAFTQVNGIPTDRASLDRFTAALVDDYSDEALMRMVALISLDGIIPLGPDFTGKINGLLKETAPSELENNPTFKRVGELIPGNTTSGQLFFVTESFEAVQDWIDRMLEARGLSLEAVTGNLGKYINFTDDKLDYLAAFIDMTTAYYAHTGTQTLVHNLVERAAKEI